MTRGSIEKPSHQEKYDQDSRETAHSQPTGSKQGFVTISLIDGSCPEHEEDGDPLGSPRKTGVTLSFFVFLNTRIKRETLSPKKRLGFSTS
jgi:hypothetical protein